MWGVEREFVGRVDIPAASYRRGPAANGADNGQKRTMSTEIAIALKLYKYQSNMQQQQQREREVEAGRAAARTC